MQSLLFRLGIQTRTTVLLKNTPNVYIHGYKLDPRFSTRTIIQPTVVTQVELKDSCPLNVHDTISCESSTSTVVAVASPFTTNMFDHNKKRSITAVRVCVRVFFPR